LPRLRATEDKSVQLLGLGKVGVLAERFLAFSMTWEYHLLCMFLVLVVGQEQSLVIRDEIHHSYRSWTWSVLSKRDTLMLPNFPAAHSTAVPVLEA
jgi:hypothetical protein